MNHQRGFTLVELIVVIILIGIISVTAASRFSGRSGFDAYITRDQAISIMRQIQIAAMQGQGVSSNNQNVTSSLLIVPSCLGAANICSQRFRAQTPDALWQQDTHTKFSSSPSFIAFNLLGQPVSAKGTRICLDNGCDIKITAKNQQTTHICINSQGYISAGVCASEY
ncbi:prepilin-type N-terminal cleavage/methylation domain-containing protein [Photobacterium damselae]